MSKDKKEKPIYTPEKVWEAFDRIEKLIEQTAIESRQTAIEARERATEADRRSAEADRQTAELKKQMAETDRYIKETNKMVNGISQSNGDFAEEAIYSALEESMVYGGIKFEDINPNMKRKSKAKKLQGEYDIVLKNGDTLAIIETKYKVRQQDVDKLVNEKVGKFRKLYPEYNDYKLILGIGGMSFDVESIASANENGVGIIKVIGEKVEFQTTDIKVY
jgi:hypothetical protein